MSFLLDIFDFRVEQQRCPHASQEGAQALSFFGGGFYEDGGEVPGAAVEVAGNAGEAFLTEHEALVPVGVPVPADPGLGIGGKAHAVVVFGSMDNLTLPDYIGGQPGPHGNSPGELRVSTGKFSRR